MGSGCGTPLPSAASPQTPSLLLLLMFSHQALAVVWAAAAFPLSGVGNECETSGGSVRKAPKPPAGRRAAVPSIPHGGLLS